MLRTAKLLVPLSVLLIAIGVTYAEKESKEKQVAAVKSCEQCEATCAECQQCPVSKAMEALPKLVYKIGDETTTSPIQAGRLAQKTKKKVKFVVLDKVFQEETEAFAELVDTTEKFVSEFAKPRQCDASGDTIVAGKSFCCEVAAGEVVTLVKKAMDDVKVTYQVGKESVCCPDAAKELAKQSGEKVVKLVAGKNCGGCSSTTRLSLAHAKYKAAVEALLAADKKQAEDSGDETKETVTKVSAS